MIDEKKGIALYFFDILNEYHLWDGYSIMDTNFEVFCYGNHFRVTLEVLKHGLTFELKELDTFWFAYICGEVCYSNNLKV